MIIKVEGGTVNESKRKRMMHKSRRKIIDVLNNEYRKDVFGTHIVTRDEREEQEKKDKQAKAERSDALSVRHTCPACNRLFGRLDRKFYYRTDHCFDCQIKFETELKGVGLYLEWEQMKIIQNELSIFRDHRQKFEDALNEIKPYTELVTDAGFINKFELAPEQFQQIKVDIQDDINFIDEKTPILIERLAELIESLLEKDKKNIIAGSDVIFKRILESK